MALGKNLARKKLLPEVEEPKVKKKTNSKSKGAPKQEKATKKETVAVKKSSTRKPAVKKAVVAKNQHATKVKSVKSSSKTGEKPDSIPKAKKSSKISQAELQSRTERRKKYNESLKSLGQSDLLFVLFDIEGEYFAIEIEDTKEVVPTPEISNLPNVPMHIKGVAQVRNQLVIFLDLSLKFSLTKSAETSEKQPYTLIVKHQNELVGILLSQVPKTFKCKSSQLKEVPLGMSLTPKEENYIKYMTRFEDKVVYVLAIDDLLKADQGILHIHEMVNA